MTKCDLATARGRSNPAYRVQGLHYLNDICGMQYSRDTYLYAPGFLRLKSYRRGFTLIEMMIVVAIIGLLASIAIPSYTRFIMKARWVENINIARAIATNAMICQQSTGSSCSGRTGQIAPSDIGYDTWPQGKYMGTVNVAFSPGGNGFHIYFYGTTNIGGYFYSRGYSMQSDGSGYIATQSFQDTVPVDIMAAAPINPSTTIYNY